MKLKALLGAGLMVGVGLVQAQDVIKIGHVGPVSGAIAHLGKDNENGARLAIEELNAKGVTIGGKKVRIELLAEDDAADQPDQRNADGSKHGIRDVGDLEQPVGGGAKPHQHGLSRGRVAGGRADRVP